jgi:hypothetical protein
MEQEFLPLNSRTYQFISNKNITVSIATKMQLLGKETLLSKKRESLTEEITSCHIK